MSDEPETPLPDTPITFSEQLPLDCSSTGQAAAEDQISRKYRILRRILGALYIVAKLTAKLVCTTQNRGDLQDC